MAALAERDRDGRAPLDHAALCKQPEGAAADGVRLLVAAGADATDNVEVFARFETTETMGFVFDQNTLQVRS